MLPYISVAEINILFFLPAVSSALEEIFWGELSLHEISFVLLSWIVPKDGIFSCPMSPVFSPQQGPHMDVQTPACLSAVEKIKSTPQTSWIKPPQSHEDLQVLFGIAGLAAVKIELFIFTSEEKKVN